MPMETRHAARTRERLELDAATGQQDVWGSSTEIYLVASLLLGPSSWSPIANHLTTAGHTATVVTTAMAMPGGPELRAQ